MHCPKSGQSCPGGMAKIARRCLLALGVLALAAPACAEDISGQGPLVVGSGQTLTIDKSVSTSSITIENGGQLIVAPKTGLGLYSGNGQTTFANAGEIRIQGDMYFSSDASLAGNTGSIVLENTGGDDIYRVYVLPQQFNELLEKGQVIAGSENATARSLFALSGMETGERVDLYNDNGGFKTATGAGRLDLKKWGRFHTGTNDLFLHGDTLQIGSMGYADFHAGVLNNGDDITDQYISQMRGGYVTLLPSTDGSPVTLSAGVLRIGRGVAPGSDQITEHSILNIGSSATEPADASGYDGTLHIKGGALVLGGGGNIEGGGTINGNIEIGGNDEATDSALIARMGTWSLNGDLTLNQSGYLEVGQTYHSDSLGRDTQADLTVGSFTNNGGTQNIAAGSFHVRNGSDNHGSQNFANSRYSVDGNSSNSGIQTFAASTFTVGGNLENSGSQILSDSTAQIGRNLSNTGAITITDSTLTVGGRTTGTAAARFEITGTSTVKLPQIRLGGGQINFDPPFAAAGDMSNAAMGGLTFASSSIDARVNVGRNSMVTIGSTDPEWLRAEVGEYQTRNSLLWGRDITTALGLRAPQTLAASGGLNVDGSWTSGGSAAAANTARFADKSLLVLDAAGIGDGVALSGNGTGALKVESGARLLVTDAAMGDEIRVTSGFASTSIAEDGWSANAATSTDLQYAEGELVDAARGEYRVRITDGKKPEEAFPALSSEMAAVVATARKDGLNTSSPNAGTRFISRAVDNRYLGANDRMLAAATMESAARITVAGAVPQMAMAANTAAGAAITQRTGFAQPNGILRAVDPNGDLVTAQKRFARQFALWIMPLYQSTNGFGMEAGNFDYDFNGALGGVALGGDYTLDNMLRLGVAFNIGGGYAQGSGDLNRTINNMSFWGVGAYAGWMQNNFGLTADVNYTSTYNKLKQELPWQMDMKDLKGDVTAWALSTGLRAEYKIETDMLDIIPHAGFRYTNLNVDSYDIKSNGTVINGDSYTQNIWTFPVGVSFSKKYALANGWTVKPLLDVNVTPAAGDFNAKSTVRFNGIGQDAELETKMMDYITYGGTAGIEFGNDTISLGVNYNGQFGAESSAHGVFGTLRVEF